MHPEFEKLKRDFVTALSDGSLEVSELIQLVNDILAIIAAYVKARIKIQ